jgi:hypothetical protein
MPDEPRVRQSRSDLEALLAEQLRMLRTVSDAYDIGSTECAKYIAVTLRVLLHDTASSHSLLGQLERLDRPFLSTVSPHTHLPGVTQAVSLTGVRHGPSGAVYLPACMMPTGFSWSRRMLSFGDWWTEVVVIVNSNSRFTRRDLVLNVANQDGGAHVDCTIKADYEAYSRRNGLGWLFSDARGFWMEATGGPHLATLRQISYELVESMRASSPELLPNGY